MVWIQVNCLVKDRLCIMDTPDLRFEINQDPGADINQIDYIEKPITYQEFFTEYLLGNKPCVFGSWATNNWRSRAEWG